MEEYGEYENDILPLTKNDRVEKRKGINELRIRKSRQYSKPHDCWGKKYHFVLGVESLTVMSQKESVVLSAQAHTLNTEYYFSSLLCMHVNT